MNARLCDCIWFVSTWRISRFFSSNRCFNWSTIELTHFVLFCIRMRFFVHEHFYLWNRLVIKCFTWLQIWIISWFDHAECWNIHVNLHLKYGQKIHWNRILLKLQITWLNECQKKTRERKRAKEIRSEVLAFL